MNIAYDEDRVMTMVTEIDERTQKIADDLSYQSHKLFQLEDMIKAILEVADPATFNSYYPDEKKN